VTGPAEPGEAPGAPRSGARRLLGLARSGAQDWGRVDAPLHAAALAYYTLFSLAPLALLVVLMVSQVFHDRAGARVEDVLRSALGPGAVSLITGLLGPPPSRSIEGLAALLSLLLLGVGASSLFLRFRRALHAMWWLPAPERTTWRDGLRERTVAATMALALGLVILAGLLVGAGWDAVYGRFLAAFLPRDAGLLGLVRPLLAPVAFIGVFAAIFRWLPRATLGWRHVLAGAAVAGGLFWLTSQVFGWALSLGLGPSLSGAVGTAMAFLLWTYVSALGVLAGAWLAAALGRAAGEPAVPDRPPA
jgi:membrane protein